MRVTGVLVSWRHMHSAVQVHSTVWCMSEIIHPLSQSDSSCMYTRHFYWHLCFLSYIMIFYFISRRNFSCNLIYNLISCFFAVCRMVFDCRLVVTVRKASGWQPISYYDRLLANRHAPNCGIYMHCTVHMSSADFKTPITLVITDWLSWFSP